MVSSKYEMGSLPEDVEFFPDEVCGWALNELLNEVDPMVIHNANVVAMNLHGYGIGLIKMTYPIYTKEGTIDATMVSEQLKELTFLMVETDKQFKQLQHDYTTGKYNQDEYRNLYFVKEFTLLEHARRHN